MLDKTLHRVIEEYIEAMAFAESAHMYNSDDPFEEGCNEILDTLDDFRGYNIEFYGDGEETIRSRCQDFLSRCPEAVRNVPGLGHSFYLDSQGHGTGFVDCPEQWLGYMDVLHMLADSYKPFDFACDWDGDLTVTVDVMGDAV